VDAFLAQLAVAQARDGVVFVQAVVGLGRRLDVPGDQRGVHGLRDLIGEDSLAGAGLALDQQGALESDRRIDRDPQVVGGDVVGRAFEAVGLTGHGGSGL